KNAAAGLINIVTNAPVLAQTIFLSHVQYGSLTTPDDGDSYQLNLGANLPLGDTMALRTAAFYNRDPGVAENVNEPNKFLGKEQYGGRFHLLWEASDAASITLSGDYAYGHGPGESIQVPYFADPAGSLTALLGVDGITASPDNEQIASN